MFFSAIYNITIYPIEFIIESIFYLFYNKFQSSYVESLIFLSISVNLLSLPLYNIAEKWQDSEREIQNKMKPMIENIKAVYKGDQRYLLIRACQRIHGYKTIYAFRGTLGLLIQIPFFIAAYNFVYSINNLEFAESSFFFIKNLSFPDSIITFNNFSVNLLPFTMTIFSLAGGFIYAKKLTFKESLPLYIIPLIFLVLLYNSPSALLIYWNSNCLFSLIKNIVIKYKLYNIFVINRKKLLKSYNIFILFITFTIIVFALLGILSRKASLTNFQLISEENNTYLYQFNIKYYSKIFISSDLYKFRYNGKYDSDNIIKIDFDYTVNTIKGKVLLNKKIEDIHNDINIYYRLYINNYIIYIYSFLLILLLFFHFNKIYNLFLRNENIRLSFEHDNKKLLISSCLIISALSGLLIPTSLISSSPTEFQNVFNLIYDNFFINIGIFLFYPIFIYFLSSAKIKNYFSLLILLIVPIILFNTFIMVGDYGHITSDFIFENHTKLLASKNEILISVLISIIYLIIMIFAISKYKILNKIYSVLLLTILIISIYNIYNISSISSKVNNNNNNLSKNNSEFDQNKFFRMSETGTNVFVFILDMALNSAWQDALEDKPEYKTNFDGFTLFPNTVTLASGTSGIASLLGGYDYVVYDMSIKENKNITNFHDEALLSIPLSLRESNYSSSVLQPFAVNFNFLYDLTLFNTNENIKASYIGPYIGNSLKKYYEGKEVRSYKNVITRFSIFRMLPIYLRNVFYQKANWFLKVDNFETGARAILHSVLLYTKDLVQIEKTGNFYNILHNDLTHNPHYFDSNFYPTTPSKAFYNKKYIDIYGDEVSAQAYYANISAMNSILVFTDFLKEHNMYDNTKIILVSDHGLVVNTKYTSTNQILPIFHALLMYKDFNSRGEVKIDTNLMTIADVPYLATKHIPNIKNYFTGNIITNNYKLTNDIKIASFESMQRHPYSNRYNFNIYYSITNNIFDTNNWKKFRLDWTTKESKLINNLDLES